MSRSFGLSCRVSCGRIPTLRRILLLPFQGEVIGAGRKGQIYMPRMQEGKGVLAVDAIAIGGGTNYLTTPVDTGPLVLFSPRHGGSSDCEGRNRPDMEDSREYTE
jgi:hypothetical protein